MERETRIELATNSLEGCDSTIELLPLFAFKHLHCTALFAMYPNVRVWRKSGLTPERNIDDRRIIEKESAMSKLNESDRDKVPTDEFAFPKQRKEPLNDATHVRNAIARFDQVKDVTDEERDEAWRRIKKAANKFQVELNESSWRELPHSHTK